eukprot:scpid71760/ scgid13096/ 
MVRVVNGVLVDDDDPRAQGNRGRREQRGVQGGIHQHQPQEHDQAGYGAARGPHAAQPGHHVSPLDTANEKLLSLGIPRLQVAGYQLEPIVMVGFVLAFMLMGLPGVLLGAVLFYLHHNQQRNPPNPANRGGRQR